ncbi:MAG: hypothetical protein IJU15_01330 [Synergistaceae bacterium]|nr:hypothetical protein [Synergistaceae bacterium]
MKNFENKYPYFWLISGLVLTMLSYGIFNTGICAWIFAIPLIRFINNRTKWSSIILMLVGMIIAANITFFRLVEDNFNINNQIFCSLNGIRIWFPFFIYFLCRYLGAKRIIAYYSFPAAVAAAEFFIDNPFISVMTSLSVSQFWNLGLMQLASVTGVVGVSFTVTVRVAAGVENFNLLLEDKSILERYAGSDEEKMLQANVDIITERAKRAVQNESTLLVFPEDAFACSEPLTEKFIERVETIARENRINIILPLLILPLDESQKKKNTLNFINSEGELLNTYLKNHLVPVVEEPFTEKGDGKTPIVEVDGVKYTYLICADYTSNKYAY